MKLRNLRIERQPKFMIIPMIDIIFFLLVFFMMSSLSMIQQATLPVALPQSTAAQKDSNKHIAVTITDNGSIFLDQEELSADLMDKRIRRALADKPDATFVLRAHKEIPYGTVIAVMDALKKAGARHVSVATELRGS
jgi:biopolymer transport protein ExbD